MMSTDSPAAEPVHTAPPESQSPSTSPEGTSDVGPAATEAMSPSPAPAPAAIAQPVPEVPAAPHPADLSRIAQDFQIKKLQVEAVLHAIDAGESVPFIARHRRDKTLGLPEEMVRRIAGRLFETRAFADRKRVILKSIATHGRLTDELTAAILQCDHPRRLEDLYVPFKPKKKSLAAEAKLRGWGDLAEAVWANDPAVADLPTVLAGMIDPDAASFTTVDDIRTGVRNIVAEQIADTAKVRGSVRAFAYDTGTLVSTRMEGVPDDRAREFAEFFEYQEPISAIPPFRFAMLVRGERERILQLKFAIDPTKAREVTWAAFNGFEGHPHRELLREAADDAVTRLILPAIEKDIRRDFADLSNQEVAHGFARHLATMLMQPPIRGRRVLAIDPGFRQGCKLAALDESGALLDHDTIFPHMPQRRVELAKKKVEFYLRKYGLNTVVIGNGPASRETEFLVADLFAEMTDRKNRPELATLPKPAEPGSSPHPVAEPATPSAAESVTAPEPPAAAGGSETDHKEQSPATTDPGISTETATTPGTPAEEKTSAETGSPSTVTPGEPAAPPEPEIDLSGLPDPVPGLCYVLVNEAGAGAYANSPAAKAEFPTLDPMTCTAISIGRRLADPLAEYVKFDPQSIGPVFHPQDGRPKFYKELLQGVVESAVNAIGADVNQAATSMLRSISGLTMPIAREIVHHRISHGPFASREALKAVPGMTEKIYEQCAGFLFVKGGPEPLDETRVHPDHYPAARKLLEILGIPGNDLRDPAKLPAIDDAFRRADVPAIAATLNLPIPGVIELMEAMAKTGYDPRNDLPPPVLKSGLLKLDDLSAGMELTGTILNVVPFGAFVDIGTRETGLIHISQLANRYVKSPLDLVAPGDVVTCWVVEVKPGDKKVSLTLIPPASARRPEPRPEPPREFRQEPRAPRPERRPEPAPRPERRPEPPREGQGSSGSAGGRGMPPKPKRFAEPGAWRRAGQPKQAPKPAETPAAETPAAAPKKEKKPRAPQAVNLTQEQKAGKAALNSFGQLFALIKTKESEEKPRDKSEEKPDTAS